MSPAPTLTGHALRQRSYDVIDDTLKQLTEKARNRIYKQPLANH